MRALLLTFAVLLALILGVSILLPMGELVVLRTLDAKGLDHDSTLWIVAVPGAGLYLRAGDPAAGWLQRLAARPQVTLRRGGIWRSYRATPVDEPGVRQAVNAALARKYGGADRVVRRFVDLERAIPVRLEPDAGEERGDTH